MQEFISYFQSVFMSESIVTVIHSFFLVALTEMGDKTQLLAFVLACRFKKPWTIMGGILAATILNHLLAASLGAWLSSLIPALYLKWGLAFSFFAFALWILIPDKEGDSAAPPKWGAFLTTLITFFLAEMGDKTQLSTLALAAQYKNIYLVTIGTTLGMLFSDGLAVFFGEKVTRIIPTKWIHRFASLTYVVFGAYILLN